MAKVSVLVSASALFLVAASFSGAALAGGNVIEERVYRPHHRHSVMVQRETYVSHDFAVPAAPPVGSALHRGAFHGRYTGGNYAYNPAYLEVERRTADYGPTRPLGGIVYGSDSYNSIPYAAGYIAAAGAGGYAGAGYGAAGPGGGMMFEQATVAAPAPVSGFRNEYRTRDAYGFNYDYETENPACWKSQYVGGQIRHVWTCPGGQ